VFVPAHGSRKLELDFGTAKVGSVIVLSDRPGDLTATIGSAAMRTGDLLGVPAYFLVLSHPGTITLMLKNEGGRRAAVTVQFRADSTRRIELDVQPKAVQPGATLTFTATVTEPTAADVVHVVIGHGDELLAELEPERVSDTTWRMSYKAPEAEGFYAMSARVDGGPPRQISGITGFEVAHRGTRITGFDEITRDTDGDDLIDWLVIRLDVTVSTPGQYLLDGILSDASGASLPVGSGNAEVFQLRPGAHVLELRWSGAMLQATRTPGPYGIAHVRLIRVKPSYRTETDIRELGKTRAYQLSEFDPDEP
jgi:hypothetical protein